LEAAEGCQAYNPPIANKINNIHVPDNIHEPAILDTMMKEENPGADRGFSFNPQSIFRKELVQ
jgi:hypothetical protein